jgi:hypothetical protein
MAFLLSHDHDAIFIRSHKAAHVLLNNNHPSPLTNFTMITQRNLTHSNVHGSLWSRVQWYEIADNWGEKRQRMTMIASEHTITIKLSSSLSDQNASKNKQSHGPCVVAARQNGLYLHSVSLRSVYPTAQTKHKRRTQGPWS